MQSSPSSQVRVLSPRESKPSLDRPYSFRNFIPFQDVTIGEDDFEEEKKNPRRKSVIVDTATKPTVFKSKKLLKKYLKEIEFSAKKHYHDQNFKKAETDFIEYHRYYRQMQYMTSDENNTNDGEKDAETKETLIILSYVCIVRSDLQMYDEALKLFKECLEKQTELCGEEDPQTLSTMSGLTIQAFHY
jgi:hypothetical protein